MPRWDVHLLERAAGTEETPYTLDEPMVACRALPFLAARRGAAAPEAPEVSRTWMDYPAWRLAILIGLDVALDGGADVVRLSIESHAPHDSSDPLEISLTKLLEADAMVVVAAGNAGPGAGTLSEFARVDGVVSVGATDAAGELLQSSGRGRAEGPWPTVVAVGTDELHDPVPLAAGTSFAAPRVALLCLLLRAACRWLGWEFAASALDGRAVALPERPLIATLDTGFDRGKVLALREMRRRSLAQTLDGPLHVGGHENRYAWMRAVAARLGQAGLGFEMSGRAAVVRRVLEACADPSRCGERAACGAGFVSEGMVYKFLAELTPSRLYGAFGDLREPDGEQRRVLEELDRELGPLWGPGVVGAIQDLYLRDYDEIGVRVMA
jgi:hypothetical protein